MIINETTLSGVVEHLQSLDQAAKAAAMDIVASRQPQLFDMVLLQKTLGATLETLDCLLEILLVSSCAVDQCQPTLPQVSNEAMISELNRFVKEVGFASDLPVAALTQSVEQYRAQHPEPVLFRWALQQLSEAGLTDFGSDQNSALLAGCTIVNCLSRQLNTAKQK